jgi:hypothetical protein
MLSHLFFRNMGIEGKYLTKISKIITAIILIISYTIEQSRLNLIVANKIINFRCYKSKFSVVLTVICIIGAQGIIRLNTTNSMIDLNLRLGPFLKILPSLRIKYHKIISKDNIF